MDRAELDRNPCIVGASNTPPEPAPARPSVRSPFVDGLAHLNAVETRKRLAAVRAAVEARIDEVGDHDVKLGLMRESDRAGRHVMEAARDAIDWLANALAASHGEPCMPSARPDRRSRA